MEENRLVKPQIKDKLIASENKSATLVRVTDHAGKVRVSHVRDHQDNEITFTKVISSCLRDISIKNVTYLQWFRFVPVQY